MTRTKTFAALALALAVPALGAPALVAAQATAAPSAVPAGTYQVESHHTLAEFTVSHFGFKISSGSFPVRPAQ